MHDRDPRSNFRNDPGKPQEASTDGQKTAPAVSSVHYVSRSISDRIGMVLEVLRFADPPRGKPRATLGDALEAVGLLRPMTQEEIVAGRVKLQKKIASAVTAPKVKKL